MSWGEALRHTHTLAGDLSSHVGAALSGLKYPVTREAVVLMDLYDLEHHIAWAEAGGKGSAPRPYERPWHTETGPRKTKPDASLTQAEIVAALRAAGHTAPLPGT